MPSKPATLIEQAGDADPAFATTLAKGLAVLETFSGKSARLSNSEIAIATGLARPTVARLTQTLCELGYLNRTSERGKYRLWIRALSLAHPLLAEMTFRQIARPLMQELAASVRGTVSVGMLDGLDLIYIETARSGDLGGHIPDIGSTVPLVRMAMGRSLLSMLPMSEQRVLERRYVAERPDIWRKYEIAVGEGLREISERGFCASRGDWVSSIHAVGTPLFRDDGEGGICFAINCGIPAFRLRTKELEGEIGPRLLDLARAIRIAASLPEPPMPAAETNKRKGVPMKSKSRSR
jgi:DNA-binding IclR family transcriptional regulator